MLERDLHDARILLVDDEPGAIRVMRSLLSDFRRLSFARSGADALRHIRASPPELVIVDVNMPGMSGLQLCDQLQADAALKDVPVIVATAEQLTSIESAALQRGAVDFVTKPLVPETFVARVRSHLRARELAEQVHQSLAGPKSTARQTRRHRACSSSMTMWGPSRCCSARCPISAPSTTPPRERKHCGSLMRSALIW
jgi:CheY-like chemotaxis protein